MALPHLFIHTPGGRKFLLEADRNMFMVLKTAFYPGEGRLRTDCLWSPWAYSSGIWEFCSFRALTVN